MRRLIAFVLLAGLSAPTFAADAGALYRQGQFREAATAARAEASVEGLALAARATLIEAAYRATRREEALALIAQATRDADAALAKNPRSVDALLQKAIAIGYRAKLEQSAKRAKAARKLMEAARKADPNNALAWAAIGGWHGDAIADLGGLLAGAALGAKRGEADRALAAAIAKDPANPSYPAFHGLMLLRIDKNNAEPAAALLERAVRLTPRDAFEAMIRGHAEQVLGKLRAQDIAGARALAMRLQAFGGLG